MAACNLTDKFAALIALCLYFPLPYPSHLLRQAAVEMSLERFAGILFLACLQEYL